MYYRGEQLATVVRRMLAGHQQEICTERDRKVQAAREQRKIPNQRATRRMKRITSSLPKIRDESCRQLATDQIRMALSADARESEFG
jgi:hypothetical protein